MVKKRYLYVFSWMLFCSFLFSSLSFVNAWTLSGTVYDNNGGFLNNTNITISSMYAPGGGAPIFYKENTTQSNASGYFILSVDGTLNSSGRNYLVTLKHLNLTTNKVDFVGQSLPYFPSMMFSSNFDINFYMKPAGTINITAINSSGERIGFNYQIKDSQLGYTIDQNWNTGGPTGALEANAYLPLDRNYSIMLYPRSGGMPLSYSWTNFSASSSYDLDALSNYNVTTKILKKQFNTTTTMTRITGYIDGSLFGITGWDNFTVIPLIMESGRFIFLQHSSMPYNMSSWMGESDVYNYTSGFYNITIPGPVESQTILFYVSALNNSNYYGSYKNISISYGQSAQYNLTMYGLLGSSMRNISMGSGFGSTNILTKMMSLNLVNATDNQTLTNTGTETHVEVVLDYSSIGVSEFVITDSVSGSGSAIFYLPMLNISGSKEINVFSNSFAPKRVDKRTAVQLLTNNNIGLSSFSPQTRDGIRGSQISMVMITSNSSCDVPVPPFSCYRGSPNGNMSTFNPISTVIGGGKISFRMGYGNISVHYVNVDMLASGPPDASFDSQGTDRVSTTFQSVMKFGSSGPKIYDYVLVSMPYDEKVLREFQPVNISIPLLYDEDWNVIWNVTANGSNAASLSGNYSHYIGKENAWGNLTQSKICTRGTLTSSSQINETNPCYIDTTRNKIWIRIPHFSGTEPQVEGGSSSSRYTAADGIDYKDFTETSGSYLNRNYILINVTSNITNFNNLTVYLYNSTPALVVSNYSIDPTFWVNMSGLTNGIWFFNATVFNDTGGFNSALTRNITIDLTNPADSIISPVNYENSSRTIRLNLTNNDTNYYRTIINITNSSGFNVNSTINSTQFVNLTLSVGVDGLYTITTTTYDLAGNSNSSSVNVTVDVTPPSLTFFSLLNNSKYYVNQSIYLAFRAYDSLSIPNSAWINFNETTNMTLSCLNCSASSRYYYNRTLISYTTSGLKNISIYVNDSLNNLISSFIVINVSILNSTNALIINDTNYTVNDNITKVVVPFNSTLTNITLTNQSLMVNLDLSQLMINSGLVAVGNNNLTLITLGSSNNYTVFIPADTNITGSSDRDGIINLPLVNTSNFTSPSLSGYTSNAPSVVLDTGSNTELNFTSPVKVVLGGMAGKRAGWARGNMTLVDINIFCNSGNSTNLTAPTNISLTGSRECYINDGSDLIIWTYHFTNFAAYSVSPIVASDTTTNPSGGSGPATTIWAVNYYPTNAELVVGKTYDLINKARVVVKVSNQTHEVGIIAINSTSQKVTINVSSKTQQVVMAPGEEKKFDVNADNYYDLYIKINNITSTKVNLLIKTINENMVSNTNSNNVAGENNVPAGSNQGIGSTFEDKENQKSLLYAIMAIIVVIVIIVIYFIFKVHKKRKYYLFGY